MEIAKPSLLSESKRHCWLVVGHCQIVSLIMEPVTGWGSIIWWWLHVTPVSIFGCRFWWKLMDIAAEVHLHGLTCTLHNNYNIRTKKRRGAKYTNVICDPSYQKEALGSENQNRDFDVKHFVASLIPKILKSDFANDVYNSTESIRKMKIRFDPT